MDMVHAMQQVDVHVQQVIQVHHVINVLLIIIIIPLASVTVDFHHLLCIVGGPC
jgi:hypothetical protein